MGTFSCSGIGAELEKFDLKRRGADEAISKAVKAGGQVLAKRLKDAAPERSGGPKRSIKASKVEYNAGDGFHCNVGPDGKDAHGVPYAKIGNILEYGRSAQARDPGRDVTAMPKKPWFVPTVNSAENEVVQAMRDAFNGAQK